MGATSIGQPSPPTVDGWQTRQTKWLLPARQHNTETSLSSLPLVLNLELYKNSFSQHSRQRMPDGLAGSPGSANDAEDVLDSHVKDVLMVLQPFSTRIVVGNQNIIDHILIRSQNYLIIRWLILETRNRHNLNAPSGTSFQ